MNHLNRLLPWLSLLGLAIPLHGALTETVRWRIENQHYDLVLNPETIPHMTDHPFETYWSPASQETRLVIDDRVDGLWRVNEDLVLYRSGEPGNLPGDQHTLSFNKAKNVLIEGLDIYAHEVEEALKFSGCANIVVRNCHLIASRTSEDALDIVRGQNYLLENNRYIGLGDREVTIKGGARYIDISGGKFGTQSSTDFFTTFYSANVEIGDKVFNISEKLIPRKVVPNYISFCLLLSSDRALGVEVGGWSDYDVGYLTPDGVLQERPPTTDVRVNSTFVEGMGDICDRKSDLVPLLRWNPESHVEANAWIFDPAESDLLGDLIEDIYYRETRPSAAEVEIIRTQLGGELDYFGVELPRYELQPREFGNNRFFGALYNWDNQYLYSPLLNWIFVYSSSAVGHGFPAPGMWFFHYDSGEWFMYLDGEILPEATWYQADGTYATGLFEKLD